MLIKVIRRIGEAPVVLEGAVVLVEDRQGNIVSASVQMADNAIQCSHALDPHHQRILRALGLDKILVCDRLELPSPPSGAELIRSVGG